MEKIYEMGMAVKDMRTLVIHPKDSSTTFLDILYKDIPQKTIITGGVTKSELFELIQNHERIMMMGHGSPGGLFSVGKFKESGAYIIDHTFVPILKGKSKLFFTPQVSVLRTSNWVLLLKAISLLTLSKLSMLGILLMEFICVNCFVFTLKVTNPDAEESASNSRS